MSFLEGYRLDLGALIADLWNIQPQMVSLGKILLSCKMAVSLHYQQHAVLSFNGFWFF